VGTLFKRNGRYFANYLDRRGDRKRKALHTTDPKVARERLRDLELATTDRASHTLSTDTLAHALSYFVDVQCAPRPAATISSYRQKARHLARLIGATLLDDVTREVIERYIATRIEEGAHPHSVHKELVVLRGTLTSAHDRKRTTTPAQVVPRFSAEYTPRTTYLTPDQFMALTDHLVPQLSPRAAAQTRERHERRRVRRALYCLLIALASPRSGEVEALRWGHVDLSRGILRIPKGKTVSRVIAIHPVLRPWLEALVDADPMAPLVDRWGNVRRDLPRACERAGVPRVTPNDLRRTFASWLVQAGTSLLVVSRLLGHSSTRMVDLVYGQLDEATLAAAVQRLPGGDHWDAGGTHTSANRGTGGAPGTVTGAPGSADIGGKSGSCVVPRDGIEPPTRGFSVPAPMAELPKRRARLRAV
jgi:integrase